MNLFFKKCGAHCSTSSYESALQHKMIGDFCINDLVYELFLSFLIKKFKKKKFSL